MLRTSKHVEEAELRKLVQTFLTYTVPIQELVEYDRPLSPKGRTPGRYMKSRWNNFISPGYALCEALLGTKEIPKEKAKSFEMATRLFLSQPRPPRDIVKWWDKNYSRIQFLLEAAERWPDKKEGGEQMFKLGPFLIQNTIGLEGTKLEPIKDTIEKVIKLVKGCPLPGFSRVLYGEINIVGRLAKKTWIAWYATNSDTISIRPFTRFGSDTTMALIHELAHRYWKKFRQSGFNEWHEYHYKLGSTASVKTPDIGDVFPLNITGEKGQTHKIEGIEAAGRRGDLYYRLDSGGLVSVSGTLKVLEQQERLGKYPTPYSSTSAEEHFCEATALLAMGKLPKANKEAYEAIFIKGEDMGAEITKQAGTYVQISREMLEDWLDSLPSMRGKWKLKQGRAGIYLLPLSDTVAVSLSSTIGSKDDAMGRGMASMKLSLVSLITKQVLNKKAMGQSMFKRTLNWRTTWRKGFDRMKEAYTKSKSFYDAIASIEDRDKYKAEMLAKIEVVSGWENHQILADIHARVEKGSILTAKQVALIDRIASQAASAPSVDDEYLQRLRRLWVSAKQSGDDWTMDFVKSIGLQIKSGRKLSDKQQKIIDDKLRRYRVSHRILIRQALASSR